MEKGFDLQQAVFEASRCLLCHDAPCSKGCPAGTDPATFIRKLRLKNITGAVRTIKQNNILGGACGVLCPSARLCEEKCSASGIGAPIKIAKIQRFLVEHSWQIGGHEIWGHTLNSELSVCPPERVAVVGSGPAGLSCAAELAKDGYRVTVFEERPSAGGVLRYGVPEYRFSKEFLERELEDIRNLGVEFKYGAKIIGSGGIECLFKDGYKAVFIATGLWQAIRLKSSCANFKGLFASTDFLAAIKDRKVDEITQYISGKNVAVIGGGSVAIDCAMSAKRLGAKDVYLVYRRSYTEMPAEQHELAEALNGGIHLLTLNQPLDHVVGENGRLTGIKLVRTRLGDKDASGRRSPVPIEGSDWILPADVVIEAIGNIAEDGELAKTSMDGVFAGGDVVRGASLVVNAVSDGKTAARAINEFVSRSTFHVPRPTSYVPRPSKADLSVDFCGVKFLNPFMLASSPVSNTAEMIGRAFDAGWGGVAFKTISADGTKIIHPSPRMHGYNVGDKKLVGLQNVEQVSDRGLKANLADITHLKKHWPKHVVMASIMGFSSKEWSDLARVATDAGADMLELNFSCPHMTIEGSGYKVGQANQLIERFTAEVKNVTRLPIVAKMTPNITDMNEPAMYAKKGGANGISAINTVRGISEVGLNDWIPRPNVAGNGAISGYSGPAVKPIGLRFIAEMAKNKELGLPLSGIGGIETWIDALEYILVGATTVQVTTGIIHYGYRLVEDMIEGLSDYMAARGIRSVSELVGRALVNLHETSSFDLTKQGRAEYNLDRCIGCGQCYIVCQDAGGQALEWRGEERRPKLVEDKCLSCMICSFVCPVDGLITYKRMPGAL